MTEVKRLCLAVIMMLINAWQVAAADIALSDLSFENSTSITPSFSYSTNGVFSVQRSNNTSFKLVLWKFDQETHKPKIAHETNEKVSFVDITADGKLVVSSFGTNLTLWEIKDDQLRKIEILNMKFGVHQFAINQEGNRLVVEYSNNHFSVFDISKNGILFKVSQETSLGISLGNMVPVFGTISRVKMAVSPDGKAFITGNESGEIATYLIGSDRITKILEVKVFEARINGLQFTSSTGIVAQTVHGAIESLSWSSGLLDEVHVLRKASTQETIARTFTRFSLSSDGRKLISRDRDGTLLLWVLRDNFWKIAKELSHPQTSGYKDAFFSFNVPVLWDVKKEWGVVMTEF